MVDLHQANPEGVLYLAAGLRVLPTRVWIIGCQAVSCDDLGAPLSGAVAHAVPLVVEEVQRLIQRLIDDSSWHAIG